nr:VOC family protein [uncultured Aquimarina sp.]
MNLGSFSLSLAVKDIHASKGFYEKLGFEIVDGNLDQKWVILKNDRSKIGLFQGMFPTNTLTFTPTDVRKLHQHIKAKKIEVGMTNGIDTKKGPASFMITDPDNNPILIDQH